MSYLRGTAFWPHVDLLFGEGRQWLGPQRLPQRNETLQKIKIVGWSRRVRSG